MNHSESTASVQPPVSSVERDTLLILHKHQNEPFLLANKPVYITDYLAQNTIQSLTDKHLITMGDGILEITSLGQEIINVYVDKNGDQLDELYSKFIQRMNKKAATIRSIHDSMRTKWIESSAAENKHSRTKHHKK